MTTASKPSATRVSAPVFPLFLMLVLALALGLGTSQASYADDATWSAIGRADEVRISYSRYDGGGACTCTFNGSDVCTPSSTACFKDRVELFISVTDPAIPYVKPGISSQAQQKGGHCYHADGFNVWPLCEDLGDVLGSCTKVQDHVYFPPANGSTRAQTIITYRCAYGHTPQCLGIAGHLSQGQRVEQVTDAYGNGGGVPEHPLALQQRVANEGCN